MAEHRWQVFISKCSGMAHRRRAPGDELLACGRRISGSYVRARRYSYTCSTCRRAYLREAPYR